MLPALVRRAEPVALEVLEVRTGRKLPTVIRHNDLINFRRLLRLGAARATHMGGVDRPVGPCGFGDHVPHNRSGTLRWRTLSASAAPDRSTEAKTMMMRMVLSAR